MPLFEQLKDSFLGVDGIPLAPEKIMVLNKLVTKQVSTHFELLLKERLRSKKNLVYHLILAPERSEHTINIVAKAFVAGNYDLELNLLERSLESGLKVPKVIDAEDGVFLMDYIDGELLVDRINRTFEIQLIDDLAQWYYDFHNAHQLLKGDPRLRNFIVSNETLYGLDLEEARQGHWMEDIGGVAASLLDTDPINDFRKRIMIWHLLDKYLSLLDVERTKEIECDFIDIVSNTLKQTAHWRKSEAISNLAKQVQKDGIPIE